jgi:hypothetical protein
MSYFGPRSCNGPFYINTIGRVVHFTRPRSAWNIMAGPTVHKTSNVALFKRKYRCTMCDDHREHRVVHFTRPRSAWNIMAGPTVHKTSNVALFKRKYRCTMCEDHREHLYTCHGHAPGVMCQAPGYVQAYWQNNGFQITHNNRIPEVINPCNTG